MKTTFDFSELAKTWPSPLVTRSEVKRFSGGLLNGRTLANLDSAGLGPPNRIRVGRKIAYPVRDLIRWIAERAQPCGQAGGEN